MIPHLTASLTGPPQELKARILENDTTVEHWQEHTPPLAPSGEGSNRFHSHGVIGRLALAAAAIELERTAPVE